MSKERAANAGMLLVLVPIAAGLAASAILLVDYLKPVAVFCEEGGGCAALKQTAYARLLGLPTPMIGVGGFAVMGALALLRGAKARTALAFVAGVAALVGAFLIVTQLRLHTYCKFCLVADVSSVVTGLGALVRARARWDLAARAPLTIVAATSLVIAVVIPVMASTVVKPPPPLLIREELAKTPPGDVTVIDFIDYECPFCRMNNEGFEPVLKPYRPRVRLVRKNVPLVRIHPHALVAARAAVCGREQDKEDEMSDRLFATEPETFSDDTMVSIAEQLHLDVARFRACLSDPKTDASIDADRDFFSKVGGHGLPTIWIGAHHFDGMADPDVMRDALQDELKR